MDIQRGFNPRRQMAKGLAHPAFDAIAIMRLGEFTGDSYSNSALGCAHGEVIEIKELCTEMSAPPDETQKMSSLCDARGLRES